MNNEAGIYDDLIITKIEGGFLIILNAACKESDFEILSKLLKNKYKMKLHKKTMICTCTVVLPVVHFTVYGLLFTTYSVHKRQQHTTY